MAKRKDIEFIILLKLMESKLILYFFALLAMSLIQWGVSVTTAFVSKYIIDASVYRNSFVLTQKNVFILSVAIGLVILYPIFFYVHNKCARHAILKIRIKVIEHLGKLPISYFEQNHGGDLLFRVTSDIHIIEQVLTRYMRLMVYAIVAGICSTITMIGIDWRMASVLIILGMLLSILNIFFTKPLKEITSKIQDSNELITESLIDQVAGLGIIKMFNIEQYIINKYDKFNKKIRELSIKRAQKYGVLESINYITSMLIYICVISVGAIMVFNNKLSFGTLIAIVQLQMNVNYAFIDAYGLLAKIRGDFVSVRRISELLNISIETKQCVNISRSEEDSLIQMQNVEFSYTEKKKIINGIDLNVKKGQVIGFVGPSGGGKSTIIKLLLGFYAPDNGSIHINYKVFDKNSLINLQSLMAYVPQDAYLFNGTIEENIRYGRLNANSDEIIEAAKKANIHNFIINLPELYNTNIGENGSKLSGGQKQRIALARAFLSNAPILIMDEPTASLDYISEQLVQDAINTIMKERTIIIIAHRLTTIKNADIIYVIKEGKIIEKGRHDELLDKSRLYKNYYELQFR